MRYEESTHANKWQLSSLFELNSLRGRANKRARDALSACCNTNNTVADVTNGKDAKLQTVARSLCHVYALSNTRNDSPNAVGHAHFSLMDESDPSYGPTMTSDSICTGSFPMLTPADEAALISFYCSKIPLLIGPHALMPRCKRDAKVAATACLLFRRFYLSNSVMMHDPKSMLAAAAFLASKVEDCMILVGYLEMGTKEMDAPVPVNEILDAEINLIEGIGFDLLVFSPYKTVLSFTEDLRTFLKTERGIKLITFPHEKNIDEKRRLIGEDLRPILDEAMKICDDVIVSDIPLIYSPGEIGLAALMVANENLNPIEGSDHLGATLLSPRIDIMGYIQSRFPASTSGIDAVSERINESSQLIRELKEGKHGCGKYEMDLEKLKGINKKLKKCRVWGLSEKKSGTKKKKRKMEE